MRILVVHEHYRQTGGEDEVFSCETRLLRDRGHTVECLVADNRSIDVTPFSSVGLALGTVWSRSSYRAMRALLRKTRPDLVHFHNTFPLLSPAVYYAAKTDGCPVVQTLHNYRILCPAATLFRDGRPCEDCLGRTPWPAVRHACYRQSRAATAVVAAMLSLHRLARTWTDKVDIYVALTDFALEVLARGGLPREKMVVKANFIDLDPGVGAHTGGYALFVGRLSEEKGIQTLLRAWSLLQARLPLKIVGDGPLAGMTDGRRDGRGKVEWLGLQTPATVLALMKDAHVLVFPSVWYEGFPRVIVEAYATGLPVLAANVGSMSTLVSNGHAGLHFAPGDPSDLAEKATWAFEHPDEILKMGQSARRRFEAQLSPDRGYEALMAVYALAIDRVRRGRA